MKAKTKTKPKAKKKKATGFGLADFLLDNLPALSHHGATLAAFDDVIGGYGAGPGADCFHIELSSDIGPGVFPSGDYSRYSARIYADNVVLVHDTHSEDAVYCEEHKTDMRGLWDFLRQLPRPMHSFGKWQPYIGENQ